MANPPAASTSRGAALVAICTLLLGASAGAEPSANRYSGWEKAQIDKLLGHAIKPTTFDPNVHPRPYFSLGNGRAPHVEWLRNRSIGALRGYALTELREFSIMEGAPVDGRANHRLHIGFHDGKQRVVSMGGRTSFTSHIDLASPSSVTSFGADTTVLEYKLSPNRRRDKAVFTMADRIRFHVEGEQLVAFDLQLRSVKAVMESWYRIHLRSPST